MPRRPSAIAAVMSRSLSSMARRLGRQASPLRVSLRVDRLKPAPAPAVASAMTPADPLRGAGSSRPGRGAGVRRARPMKSKHVQAVILAAALVAGYGGAAAYTALAAPSLPVVTDFGPGDGLTRYVVSAADGGPVDDVLAGLGTVDGVVSAQPLSDG